MKRILITGANSYIGTSFEKWVSQWPDQYQIDTVDMVGDAWRAKSFAGYDAVLHVAGIVHKKEKTRNAYQYYCVNRDLAIRAAQKAKSEGVSHFIFLSSMSVYGLTNGVITRNTVPNPKNHYGRSKYEAEKALSTLLDDHFLLAILRPPIVYGYRCKGNYAHLSKFVKITPALPKVYNQRSMIFIDHLSEFIKLVVDDRAEGVFCPQNDQYVCSLNMIQEILKNHKHKVLFIPINKWVMRVMSVLIKPVHIAFGNMVYDKSLSKYQKPYCLYYFADTIRLTEGK